jgi:uncharacterized membrane protein YedE/YeeE
MVPQFLIDLKDFISQPWPWYVAGTSIAFIMFLLIWFGKEFGMSANLRVMCAADGADELNDFFKFDWPSQGWNLMVALGTLFGGYIAAHYFSTPETQIAHVSEATIASLSNLSPDMNYASGAVPLVPDFYSWESLFTLKGILVIVVGGFLVGFGARYAGGCTSGHAISGLSALQFPSLVAVIGFFLGGLFMTHVLLPLIF